MRNAKTKDEVIVELQNKLNQLSVNELNDTYWEIETGEYLTGQQVEELEKAKEEMIKKLDLQNNNKDDEVFDTIIDLCKKYENLCTKKYPEAPLPLEILKTFN